MCRRNSINACAVSKGTGSNTKQKKELLIEKLPNIENWSQSDIRREIMVFRLSILFRSGGDALYRRLHWDTPFNGPDLYNFFNMCGAKTRYVAPPKVDITGPAFLEDFFGEVLPALIIVDLKKSK